MTSASDRTLELGERSPDGLTFLALAYLAIPSLLFFFGWLVFPVALCTTGLLAWLTYRSVQWRGLRWRADYSRGAMVAIIAVALAWTAFGGAGHFAWANKDWLVRDTVFADLALSPWPVAYETDGGGIVLLRSAIGYFLPAAAFTKLTAPGVMDLALFLWTAGGAALFLLLLPLPSQAGGKLLGLLLVVVFFSGMDNLGIFIETGTPPIFPLALAWWVPFNYPSLSGLLYWAPNHTLPLWIATALFVRHWRHEAFPPLAASLIPVLPLWTPFTIPGLAPWYGLLAFRLTRNGQFTRKLAGTVGIAIITSVPTLAFLTLDVAGISGGNNLDGALARATAAVATEQTPQGRVLGQYLLFVLLEFVILALLVGRQLTHSHSRALLWVAGVTLAVLPFATLGPSNDLMLRASIPALVVLLALVLAVLQSTTEAWWKRGVPIALVLLVGAQTPLHEIWRAATFRKAPPNYGQTLLEVQEGFAVPHYFARQPTGIGSALLRPPVTVKPRQMMTATNRRPIASQFR